MDEFKEVEKVKILKIGKLDIAWTEGKGWDGTLAI
jgi:hypothetical protein